MGVLNVTPDSFSDGGRYLAERKAVAHGIAMARAGADIIDVGGESTRPGSQGIPVEEELRRILPVIKKLRATIDLPISVDTSRAEVAEAAALVGAEIINDVSGLRRDPRIADVAKRLKLPLILMHMRGTPATMQKLPFARNAMRDVRSGLARSVREARERGVPRAQIILDPGIGFGKSARQNCELVAGLGELAKLGYPLLVGTSRKSFIGKILSGAAKEDRAWGTAATVAASILNGAHIVRVHDVEEMVQVARVADVMREPALMDQYTRKASA